MNTSTDIKTARAQLAQDFRTVVDDTEELLRATADQTGERIKSARARMQESLVEAKRRLAELQADVVETTKAAAKRTDDYVHEHPWQSIGVAAAIGFLLGMLISRR
jgi:ElaB/YqjD/DUF883 family membrane-anchored ribosome-binding protein